jgi:hypothetical protein
MRNLKIDGLNVAVFKFVVTHSCVSLDAIQRGFESSFVKAEKVAANLDKQFDAVMQYKASDTF